MELGRKSKRSAVGMTIGRESVSMARVTMSRSGPIVEKAVTLPIPEPGGETEILEALRQLISDNKINGHELSVAVPRNEITTRIVSLPSADEGEIHQMVQLGVEEYVPYSAAELEVDEAILERMPDGSSKALVAIAHRDVVERPVEFLTKAGAEPTRIGVSCFALYNALMLGAKPGPTGPVALVDIGELGTDILVTEGGRVSFTRGVAHLRAPTATVEEISAELRNSLQAYSREAGGAGVKRVLLSGALERLDEVARTLSDTVGLDVERAGFIAQACDVRGTDAARYAVQVGLALSALREPALSINLIPRRILDKQEREEKRRMGLVTVALGCLVLALASAVFRANLADRRRYIEFLDGQIARMEQPAELVRRKKARVDTISSQLSRKDSALEVLWKMYELAPQGLVLENMDFVRGETVTIGGLCYDREIAFAFAEALRDLSGVEAWARAEVGDTQNDSVENVSVMRFEIGATMVDKEVGAPLPESSSEVELE
jgi:Tfp pilus assembly PilM family ATPase